MAMRIDPIFAPLKRANLNCSTPGNPACGTAFCNFSWTLQTPGPRFNIKMSSYQYRKSHCGDKTVVRSSYLHNGISYTGKMASFYWSRPLLATFSSFWSGQLSSRWSDRRECSWWWAQTVQGLFEYTSALLWTWHGQWLATSHWFWFLAAILPLVLMA